MTTKFKIILGFVIMILLLAAMAGYGYFQLGKSDVGFTDYRQNARVNVACSDLVSNLNAATAKTYEAVISKDAATSEAGLAMMDAFIALAKTGENEAIMPERITAFKNLQKRGADYKAELNNVRQGFTSMQHEYNDKVVPAADSIIEKFASLAEAADRIDNARILYALTQVWDNFSGSTTALNRLAETGAPEDVKQSQEQLAAIEQPLARISGVLQTEEGRRTYREIRTLFDNIKQEADAMFKSAAQMHTAMLNMRSIEAEMNAFVVQFNENVDGAMREIGTRVAADNVTAQRAMLMLSCAGIIIGAALALFIIVGIVRVLNEMAAFAAASASGNFAYQVKSKEKGEIGVVINSMKQIPEVLIGIMNVCKTLANDINSGKFRVRGDVAALPGSFHELGGAINGIAEAYTDVIDALPMPVVSCGTDSKVQFVNKPGQIVTGGENIGQSCNKLLGIDDADPKGKIGPDCMSQNKTVETELVMNPLGKHMNAAITALPLTDMSGKVAGFIEIITDLTEIRAQQRTMLQVAEQASEISNRVAAASEELSAQVEQVSRGAEMQRSRMESTASAMTEMNATVLEVARSAGQASEQTDNTRNKADEGAKLVTQVISAINAVNTIGQRLRGNMEELGKQAESIGGVMGVISDIADQTNLLALNAAIEAARAGEAGRGFAVVADEVRKLAEKTMEATQEVGSSINSVQVAARTSGEEVGKVVGSVEEATSLANSSGQALAEIVQLASASSAVVASIATAAEQQSATSEEINHSIDEVNRVVGETAEGMIQSSAAVQDLSQMAQELRRVMEGLR
ncbi:methyl-accepting chemotaxis protein [Desulfovibrio sp. OttesenSCG-928-G15]|nr:methyl-accepting chemotaxis protein [Desulfovibrio sp. OttesenSCG-928-G15]